MPPGRGAAPGGGGDSGLAWAEGTLWVGQHRARKIYQIDPETGAILRTIESNRFVTGVTWVDGELWHGTWDGDESDIRRVDPDSGAVLERLEMPPGIFYGTCSGYANLGEPGSRLRDDVPEKARSEFVSVGRVAGVERRWLTHYLVDSPEKVAAAEAVLAALGLFRRVTISPAICS